MNGTNDPPRPRDPEGIKPKDLLGQPWMLAFALRDAGWYLRSDIIWCLSGGTRLYARTQKGEMPATVHDLVRLDPATVELWNGERWTRVRGWYRAESRGEPLEIELRSGERIGCTPGHVWPTQRGNVRADDLIPGDVIASTRLPEPNEPDSPRYLPDEDVGWLVGTYLAEGSMSGNGTTVQLACHAAEARDIQLRAGAVATALHGSAVAHYTKGDTATVNLNGPLTAALLKGYIHGSTAETKGLRPRVWRRSDAFLRALLMGYLEGDGSYDAKNDRWRLGFTRNDRLAADLRTLAARLGLPLSLRHSVSRKDDKSWPSYRGDIRLNPSTHWNAKPKSEVRAIRRSRGRDFWDIEVADSPHLFALASGVLTHNSKPNPMPESVTDRPTKSHSYVFLLAKRPRYFWDAEAVREGDQVYTRRAGGYTNHAEQMVDGRKPFERKGGFATTDVTTVGRNVRSVWEIATQPLPYDHYAAFPEKLAERCIKAGTSEHGVCGECGAPWVRHEGGAKVKGEQPSTATGVTWRPSCNHYLVEPVPATVLDPFMGSGTTALVARKLGRHAVGIELNETYLRDICMDRLKQLSLFGGDKEET